MDQATIVKTIWEAQASVKAVEGEEGQKAVSLTSYEAVSIIHACHKACFANANVDDSVAFAETTLPPEKEEKFDSNWLEGFLSKLFHSLGPVEKGTTTSSSGGRPGMPVTPEQLFYQELCSCVIDDQNPVMLNYDDVLTLEDACGKLRRIPTYYSTYVKQTEYRTYPEAYDILWRELFEDPKSSQEDRKKKIITVGNTITLAQFNTWFTQVYCSIFANATKARAERAGKTLWYEIISATGDCTLEDFRRAAKHVSQLYAKCDDADGFWVDYVKRVFISQKELEKEKRESDFADADTYIHVPFYEVMLPSSSNLLEDPTNFYILDSLYTLKEERDFWKRTTANRIVVLGQEGTGKSQFAKELARKLNAVNINVYDLALQASADPTFNDLGREIQECVAAHQPIPRSLQAALVRRCLQDPATKHRGYVLGDVPNASQADGASVEKFLEEISLSDRDALPQALVELECPAEYYADWRANANQGKDTDYQQELTIRAQEAKVIADKKEAVARREEKLKQKESLSNRKAQIDAGELQATEEDANIDEILAQLAEEEEGFVAEQQQADLDEEGNPMEPEAVAAREKEVAKVRAQRMFKADLKKLLLDDRRIDPDLPQLPCCEFHALETALHICQERNRFVTLPCWSSTAEQVEFLISKLKLQQSTVPQEPALTAEHLEGIESGPDGDVALAEVKQKFMSEAGLALSEWQRFCPVTWADHHVLMEGHFAFSCFYRGYMYCFTSKARLQKFIASPHAYLLNTCDKYQPILVLQKTLTALKDAGLEDGDQLLAHLAEKLNLTHKSFNEFTDEWKAHGAEVARRADIESKRAARDQKIAAEREERRKKREKEAAAKAKKASKDKKKSKKKEDDDVPDANSPEPGDVKAAEGDVAEEQKVVTTEERLAQQLDTIQKRQLKFGPILVNSLALSEGNMGYIQERQVLPETVLLMEYRSPPKLDENGDPIAEEEEVEEVGEEEAAQENADAVDADGDGSTPIPQQTKPVKVFDPTDEKQYKKFVRKLVEKLSTPVEEGGEETAEGGAAGSAKPQTFTVHTINLYKRTSEETVSDIVQLVNPISLKALPPGDSDEIIQDPEVDPDEAPPIDPILLPGKKAIHQFGETVKFCPFTLRESGTLVYGDTANYCVFMGQKYIFVSPEAMEAFKLNPMRYLPDIPSHLPPPRVWILGVPSAGKRTLAASLSKQFGIPLFTMSEAFYQSLIAAAQSETGAEVEGGAKIPGKQNSASLQRAINIMQDLSGFEKNEKEKIDLKEKTQREQADREAMRDAGEDIDDLDDEEEAEIAKNLEFEPEEADTKTERIGKAHRQVAAALMRIQPFESHGYLLCGHPDTEVEYQQLLDEGAFPEICVQLKLTMELFVSRRCDDEFNTRHQEWKTKMEEVATTRKSLQLQQREMELAKWRRRNIGGDDEPAPELEEAPEDVEPVQLEAVKSDLEGLFDTETNNVSAIIGMLPDKRIPLVEVNGDWGKEAVVSSTVDLLAASFTRRRSLLEVPYVITDDEAEQYIANGTKNLSCFRFTDPVALFDERRQIPTILHRKPAGKTIEAEDEIPEPEPPKPKEKKKKMVTKTNEETGEDYEEEVTDHEEEEEAVAEPEEAEPENDEPEPELSPEELEEMQKEFEQKKKVKDDDKKMRVAVLRNRVYFFNNNDNLLRFLQNPLMFWEQPPPLDETSAVFAVLESAPLETDKEKQRTMAHHLAYNMKSIFIDIPKLMKWCLQQKQLKELYEDSKQFLLQKQPLSNVFLSAALSCRLKSIDVMKRGAVLLNLPRNVKQFANLLSRQVLLGGVYVVNEDVTDPKLPSMIKNVSRVLQQVQNPSGTMAALVECHTSMRNHLQCKQVLSFSRSMGFPAKICEAAISEASLEEALSIFKWYCPYMWARERQLVDMRDDRVFAAEYLGKVYCFSKEVYLTQFFQHPEVYSGETKMNLMNMPEHLPTRLESVPSHTPLEFCGCCPVTLYETRHRQGLKGVSEPIATKGSLSLVVEYEDKFYSLVDERAMTQFLRQPWVYTQGATLPLANKLPQTDSTKLENLPAEHYVTHVLYENVARAMLTVAETRPKFPGLSIEESALKFMALHLKAHNQANTEFRKESYSRNFESFMERSTLYKTITVEAPKAEDTEDLAKFDHRCKVWDDVQDNLHCYKEYATLKASAAEDEQVGADGK